MSDVEKYAQELLKIKDAAKAFTTAMSKACGGSFEWGIQQVVESYLSMYDRFCPYKKGDRVQLSRNIDVNSSSGWFHSRHFLIKGSKATVANRGYSNGAFTFDVIFDDESWIDNNGEKQPTPDSNKHTYGFAEKYLEPIPNEHMCGECGTILADEK